jgi:PAS domain S-box-containing protein
VVIDARLNDLAAMVWVTDEERIAKAFNPAWLEFVGAELEDELGWGWMRHVQEDDLLALLQAYEDAQDSRRGFEHSARVRRADGQLWWLRLRAAPRIEDGAFRGFIGMCEPIGPADSLPAPTNSGLADLLPVSDLAIEPATSVIERLARVERVLQVSRPAELLEARLLRQLASRWVNQHARLRDRHDDIVLAVSEAATNATEHAYRDTSGFVRLTCELKPSIAQFRIRDWGRWQPPSPQRDHRGIDLMTSLADDVYINHLAEGTEVVLQFRVP